ncbi:MAG: O-antigen ligase family protein [Bacteroidota bacterium]
MNELRKSELTWFYGLSALFTAAMVFFLSKEMYLAAAFPAAIAIVLLSLFALDYVLLGIAFFTPLAIVINDKSDGPAVSIPTEPLLFGAMILALFKFLARGGIDRKVAYHPVTLSIGLLLAWKSITCLTSSMPLVSIKHLLAQCWFIIPLYLLGTQLFRDPKNINRFIWCYTSSLLIVIGYTLYSHAEHDWTQEAAHFVMYPFYNDHTAYAAALALFIPPLIAILTLPKTGASEKSTAWVYLIILLVAIILSYTRAAWISLLVALAAFIVYFFRIGFWKVAVTGGTVLALFLAFQSDIFMKLEKNRQDSATDINKHLQSISNISTDASNLERINRWNSAFRMWHDRPFFGWGPGTYQFNYAPFQKSDEMTIISTNAGNRGNAHSEYIGPLAESGILGMATMILLVLVTVYKASVFYSETNDPYLRRMTLGILLGLITYFVHGTLNNFLDTDKLSVPFWAFMAMLVSLEVYRPGEATTTSGIDSLKP